MYIQLQNEIHKTMNVPFFLQDAYMYMSLLS